MNAPNTVRFSAVLSALWLVGCGAGGGGSNTAPLPVITAPAEGDTFAAGDTLTFAASASDAEDGTLDASRLIWWAELHHDSHTHPFQPEATGDSGTVTIPTRGETADTIFYRFHLRATDSSGASTEVTRDVQPRKAQLTLATVPAGLTLMLDGQPVVAPSQRLGVVGIERTLGAADQNAGGRRYAFASWSDGLARDHTLPTPVTDTTYTATYTDIGPTTNQPPSATLSAPSGGTAGTVIALVATSVDADGSVAKVEFFDGSTKLGEDLTSPYTLSWTPATSGTHSLSARATDDQGAATTSATVNVDIVAPSGNDTTPPSAVLTAPANLATGLAGSLSLSATASDNVGVASVEFQIDGIAIGAADTAAPYATTLDANGYPDGQHVLRARAHDAAGNASPWAAVTVKFATGRSQPTGFTRNEGWVTGLSSATAFAQAPDGRLFIAEQDGALRVVKNGTLLGPPFVSLTVNSHGERGLLGVALHPNFASNGFVYLYHTTSSGGTHNRISRYTASGDVAVVGSEVVLVDLPALSDATNHNGGAMHFGIDGKLYVGVGDNAFSANSQDASTALGKMLRFNDDGTIPTDNPFYATRSGQARAIWASGLRNPFTFAVQPVTGVIHINDVGQGSWEEINIGAPGANYGWPASEGPTNITSGVTGPLFTYKHAVVSPEGSGAGGFFTGFAIAGGSFYPGSGAYPSAYRAQYYFSDFVNQFVGRLDLTPGNGNAAYAFASLSGSPVGLLVGADGAVYVLTLSAITRISAP